MLVNNANLYANFCRWLNVGTSTGTGITPPEPTMPLLGAPSYSQYVSWESFCVLPKRNQYMLYSASEKTEVDSRAIDRTTCGRRLLSAADNSDSLHSMQSLSLSGLVPVPKQLCFQSRQSR